VFTALTNASKTARGSGDDMAISLLESDARPARLRGDAGLAPAAGYFST
jgi:hypothetical protein